jgi:hypothetical protein
MSIRPEELLPLIRFLKRLSSAALDFAEELEAVQRGELRAHEAVQLGALQRSVVEAPGMDSDLGISPGEITKHLQRGDEPNIRAALQSLQKRGITELIPGAKPQRWRLTRPYRS